MPATDAFFNWFYTGLNGLGGWFLFLLSALAAAIWVLYDSSVRNLRAVGWRLAVILTGAFLLPAVIFRFSSSDTQLSLSRFVEWIFYLGMLGGVLPPVLAVGYYVNYRGLVACNEGHIYPQELGTACPECARLAQPPPPPLLRSSEPEEMTAPPPLSARSGTHQPPPAPKAAAWLVCDDGRNYQLNRGRTNIGRSRSANHIVLDHPTVSREHARIVEENGFFTLYDVGSRHGVRLNGRRLHHPTLLEPGDEIQLGEVRMRFVTAERR